MIKTGLEELERDKLAVSKDHKANSLQKSVQNKQFTVLSGTKNGEEKVHFLALYKIRY